jgi:hypothetical protein
MAEITQVLGIVGMSPKGEYDSSKYYEKLNVVTYNGSSYCAKTNVHGIVPTNSDFWDLLAEKGSQGDEGPQGPKPVKGVDYWTEEDVAEIETSLDSDVTNEVSEQLSDLVSATPLVASSTADMTDTTRTYVLTTDGHWYWYNGASWQDGGVYQATGISDNSIHPVKLIKNQVTDFFTGSYKSDGTIDYTKVNWLSSPLIAVEPGDIIQITEGYFQWLTIFDSNQDLLTTKSKSPIGYDAYVLPANSAYIGLSILNANRDTCKIYINGKEYSIYRKYNFEWLDIKDNSIMPEKLLQNKITDFLVGPYDQEGKIGNNVNWMRSPLIEVEPGDVITITQAYQQYLTIFRSDITLLEVKTASPMQEKSYTLPANSAYIGINVYKDYYDT